MNGDMASRRQPVFPALLCLALIWGRSCVAEDDPLVFSTHECSLTEPLYQHKFDFTGLRSDFAHVADSANGDKFEFNICGNLTRTCDGQSNVAACLKRGTKEYVLGTQHELMFKKGNMAFKFSNGSKCATGTGQYQLHVLIRCDYILDAVQSRVTPYSSDACSFYIFLETPLACLPEPESVKSNNCSVTDPKTGHSYDLLPLSDDNYRTTDRKGNAFVINVCKPVLYGESAMCPPGSSVCFVNLKSNDHKKKYFDYGTVQANPTFEKGQLLMRQISKTSCNATANYSSTIYFYCDRGAKTAHPEFIGSHGCVYEFSFHTALACSDLAPCTTYVHGSELLDMSALMGKPFNLTLQDKQYTLAVCSSAGEPCFENDGACFTEGKQTTSLGRTNSHLRINQSGTPYLLYEGLAKCEKPHDSNAPANPATSTFWSTRIDFVCANATKNNDSSTGPKIIENSNCQLLIHYQTPLACHEQIACKAKAYVDSSEDGTGVEIVDLAPLIATTDNYVAKIDRSSITEQQVGKSTEFFLNVCRPLVSKFGLGCPGGSAACMAKVTSSSTPEEEQSLGYPLASLVISNRTTAELRYYQGGPCPTDKESQLSSRIEFYCDMRAGRGTPVLRAITDCQYKFSWATNVICPPHMCAFEAATCEIINDEINERFSLKKASFTDAGKIKIEKDKGELTLDVCGEHRKPVTDYSQGLVNLFFIADGPCSSNGQLNVQMRIICSNETERETSFSHDIECNVVYVQRTPEICAFLGIAVPPPTPTPSPSPKPTTVKPESNVTTASPKHDDEIPVAGGDVSVGAILAAILSLTVCVSCMGIFAFSPERRSQLRRLFRRGSSAVRYSRVQSNEEASLLLEPNGEFTDSDDDMLL